MVRDERTTGLPIILETPSFELPRQVWGVEIDVLGRLSLMQANDLQNPESLNELTEQIRHAVNGAKRPSNAKRKRE